MEVRGRSPRENLLSFQQEKCSPDDVLKKKLEGSNFQKPALYAFKLVVFYFSKADASRLKTGGVNFKNPGTSRFRTGGLNFPKAGASHLHTAYGGFGWFKSRHFAPQNHLRWLSFFQSRRFAPQTRLQHFQFFQSRRFAPQNRVLWF